MLWIPIFFENSPHQINVIMSKSDSPMRWYNGSIPNHAIYASPQSTFKHRWITIDHFKSRLCIMVQSGIYLILTIRKRLIGNNHLFAEMTTIKSMCLKTWQNNVARGHSLSSRLKSVLVHQSAGSSTAIAPNFNKIRLENFLLFSSNFVDFLFWVIIGNVKETLEYLNF